MDAKYKHEWYLKNRSRILLKHKSVDYKLKRKINRSKPNNKETTKEYNKMYREKNKEVIKVKRNFYLRQKYKKDYLFKLKVCLHKQFHKAVECNGLNVNVILSKKLSYSTKELKQHIESQFKPGMSWSNYGVNGWHIDHKMPKSFASNESELIDLFRLDNLQPMWSKDNISKHNRVVADLFNLDFEELI